MNQFFESLYVGAMTNLTVTRCNIWAPKGRPGGRNLKEELKKLHPPQACQAQEAKLATRNPQGRKSIPHSSVPEPKPLLLSSCISWCQKHNCCLTCKSLTYQGGWKAFYKAQHKWNGTTEVKYKYHFFNTPYLLTEIHNWDIPWYHRAPTRKTFWQSFFYYGNWDFGILYWACFVTICGQNDK